MEIEQINSIDGTRTPVRSAWRPSLLSVALAVIGIECYLFWARIQRVDIKWTSIDVLACIVMGVNLVAPLLILEEFLLAGRRKGCTFGEWLWMAYWSLTVGGMLATRYLSGHTAVMTLLLGDFLLVQPIFAVIAAGRLCAIIGRKSTVLGVIGCFVVSFLGSYMCLQLILHPFVI